MKMTLMIVGGAVVIGLLGLAGFLASLGMFGKMLVEEKVMGPYTHVYESFQGPYPETGKVFDKVYNALKAEGIDTTLGLGVYYDDPRQVAKEQLRSDCGVALQPADLDKAEALQARFKVRVLEAKQSIVTTFPIKGGLSYMMGPMKAYPALTQYAQAKGLQMTGTFEVYDVPNKRILFVATVE